MGSSMTDTQQTRQVSTERLPSEGERLREVLDHDELSKLRARFPGKRFYIPSAADGSHLSTVVGESAVVRLIAEFGGMQHVYCASGEREIQQQATTAIREKILAARKVAGSVGVEKLTRQHYRALAGAYPKVRTLKIRVGARAQLQQDAEGNRPLSNKHVLADATGTIAIVGYDSNKQPAWVHILFDVMGMTDKVQITTQAKFVRVVE